MIFCCCLFYIFTYPKITVKISIHIKTYCDAYIDSSDEFNLMTHTRLKMIE